jgi:hypothetical protein
MGMAGRRRFGRGVAVLMTLAGLGSAFLGGPIQGAKGAATPEAVVLGQRGLVMPPVLDDVEHMCALLTSCDPLPIPSGFVPADFAACVKRMTDELTSSGAIASSLLVRECGLSSNSCSELRTCALRGAKPDSCGGRGRQTLAGYCDIDGRALTCLHERVQGVRDCPRGGEQCSVRQGEALCTLGACPPEIKEGAPAVCSASGTRILRCEHGQLVSLDCTAFGLVCAASTSGGGSSGPTCAPATPPCSAGSRRCEGNVSVGCLGGHEVRIDCASGGLLCFPPSATAAMPGAPPVTAEPVGQCFSPVSAGSGCDARTPARCEGATIRYCAEGKSRSYLCKSLGFSRCGAAQGGGVRCF